jgi:hypothetical protein
MEDAFTQPVFKLKYFLRKNYFNQTQHNLVAVYSFTNYPLKYILVTAHSSIIWFLKMEEP